MYLPVKLILFFGHDCEFLHNRKVTLRGAACQVKIVTNLYPDKKPTFKPTDSPRYIIITGLSCISISYAIISESTKIFFICEPRRPIIS